MKKTQNSARRTPKKVNVQDSKAIPILKSVLLGPVIVSFIIAAIYIAWWGLSKAFYVLHNWMTTSVLGWIEGAWPYVLGIWAFVLITSVAYAVFSEKKKITEKATLEKNSNVSKADTFEGEDFFSDSSREKK